MNSNDEDKFDRWIRDNRPEIPEDEVNQKIHLAILRDRMRVDTRQRRGRMTRWGLIAAPLILLMLFAIDVMELGGDSFDLEELEVPGVAGRVFKQGVGGGMNFDEEATDDEIYETAQQIAADEGEIFSVEGWELHGNVSWSVKRRYVVNGKESIFWSPSVDPETSYAQDFLPFYLENGEGARAEAESGGLPHREEIQVRVDRCLFQVKVWEFSFPEYGLVKYYLGEPIR